MVPLAVLLGPGARIGHAEATPSVTVRWDAGLERLGRAAEEVVPGIAREVERRLGWTYEGKPPEVFLVRGADRMSEVASAAVPSWAVGATVSADARIVVRADLLALGYGGGLVPVLRHEWVHLLWGAHAGPRRRLLPLWAEEGVAEEIGGGVSVDQGAALDLAVTFGNLIPFDELQTSFPADGHDADLAYKESRSWVAHLASRCGWSVWPEILSDLVSGRADAWARGGSPFAAAVRRRSGLSLGECDSLWRQAIEAEARPWFHIFLRDLPGLLFSLIGVAAIVGSVAFFRRRRREIERLPDDAVPPVGGSGLG